MEISARKTFQGAWALSTVAGGYLISRQYFGYTKREAIALFRAYVAKQARA